MFKTALEIIKRITKSGYKAYIVGGYPRDIYLNRPSIDVDICTSATPKELKEIFGNVNLSNMEYGSVTIYVNKIRFEITTFRKEIKYENNRIPVKIRYIDSLYEDLLRRDFTINTLCIDDTGTTIDLLDITKDLDNKIIKVVGDTKKKIAEDSLRILRAIRFATILDFKLDNNLKQAIKKNSKLLKKLSYNRKKEELDKIFSSSNAIYGIDLIKELGIADSLDLHNFNSVTYSTSSIGIWAQLDVIDIYPFSNNEKELINNINLLLDENLLDSSILYKYGLYVCSIAGEIKGIDRKLITIEYNNLYIKSKSDIKIDALEICGILKRVPGAFLKDIYNDLEEKLVHKQIENESEALSKYIGETYL